MRILLLGASGFIGRHLARALLPARAQRSAQALAVRVTAVIPAGPAVRDARARWSMA